MPATIVANVGNSRRFDVTSISHPSISARHVEWRKWRLTYEGGDRFIWAFLKQYNNREDEQEFKTRKEMTYCPAFAKNALKKVRNTVFNRAREITRTGGTASYQLAVTGQNGGVDRAGCSMNYFMGIKCLDELLKMSLVGIYVDMPRLDGPSLLQKGRARPYCYLYQAEQVRSWTCHPENPTEFTSLLLIDRNFTYEEATNLPIDEADQYRYLYLKDTETGPQLFVKWYSDASEQLNWLGEQAPEFYDEDGVTVAYEEQVGNLDCIPFVLMDIGNSLLADVANYQIALMNMASSDLAYIMRAGFPFYTEQYEPNSDSGYIRRETDTPQDAFNRFTSTVSTSNGPEIVVGPTRGRKYPKGLERPGFIHPSSEPLTASMAKQEQMKLEINQLVDMTLQTLTGDTESEGVLSGLNYISYIMQWAENKIAYYWAKYEGSDQVATVIYPETLEILAPEDIQAEVTNLCTLIDKTPQIKLKKELLKKIVRLKLSPDTSNDILKGIYAEIDSKDVVFGDPLSVIQDVVNGLVSTKTASEARGYPEGESKAAEADHAARLARVQAAQTPPGESSGVSKGVDSKGVDPETAQARGLADQSTNNNAGKQEKQDVKDVTDKQSTEDPTRGQGMDKSV